jgi:hypothetical protein
MQLLLFALFFLAHASFFDAKFPVLFRPARSYVDRILNIENGLVTFVTLAGVPTTSDDVFFS